MGCYSRDAKYTTICLMGDILGGVQRKMISAPTESERTVTGMDERIRVITNIVSIVFVSYGIFVLYKWEKVADKLNDLMEETKDG